eukprot:TRINITY_DN1146_c0_g2_i2.p2 TRINITY_DN1146_c0_g2~~TRINITY_DN1146_c0_g2_i2.p2  ORF type:complete len:247 (-),score=89.39 TRINITY_DN1146_c0_g2_i2:835-1575(-)
MILICRDPTVQIKISNLDHKMEVEEDPTLSSTTTKGMSNKERRRLKKEKKKAKKEKAKLKSKKSGVKGRVEASSASASSSSSSSSLSSAMNVQGDVGDQDLFYHDRQGEADGAGAGGLGLGHMHPDRMKALGLLPQAAPQRQPRQQIHHQQGGMETEDMYAEYDQKLERSVQHYEREERKRGQREFKKTPKFHDFGVVNAEVKAYFLEVQKMLTEHEFEDEEGEWKESGKKEGRKEGRECGRGAGE